MSINASGDVASFLIAFALCFIKQDYDVWPLGMCRTIFQVTCDTTNDVNLQPSDIIFLCAKMPLNRKISY